jgi:hypothetical protein
MKIEKSLVKGHPSVGCFGSELGFLRSNNHFTIKYPIEKGCPFETPSFVLIENW